MQVVASIESQKNAGPALIEIARALALELNPHRRQIARAGLDSSQERDWGFDSLARAKLLLRTERAFSVRLPERRLGEAETLRDLLPALLSARMLPSVDVTRRQPFAEGVAEPAPAEARTLTEVLDAITA
jgi:acyl carrier protein